MALQFAENILSTQNLIGTKYFNTDIADGA